jgi:GTP-binding protein
LKAEFLGSASKPEQFPRDALPEIAFLGRSNVGKSSLINALTGQHRLAFTSNTPGRTQTINFYRVIYGDGGKYHFVDLPGYGYARVPLAITKDWKALIESYLTNRAQLELSLLVIDIRRGWMDPDLLLKEWLELHQRPYLVVATKTDKLNQTELRRGLDAIRKIGPEPVPFSAANSRGVRELWQAITKTPPQSHH